MSDVLADLVTRIISAPAPPAPGIADRGLGVLGGARARWTAWAGSAEPAIAVLACRPEDLGADCDLRVEPVGSSALKGASTVDALVDSGISAIALADPPVPSTADRAVIGLLCRVDASLLVPLTGDDQAWMTAVAAVRDAMRTHRSHLPEPLTLLDAVDAGTTAGLAGALLAAAARRIPVLLDGTTSLAAAVAADRMTRAAHRWWTAAHTPDDPAARAALDHLDLAPLLDLGMRRGGPGALLALRLLHP